MSAITVPVTADLWWHTANCKVRCRLRRSCCQAGTPSTQVCSPAPSAVGEHCSPSLTCPVCLCYLLPLYSAAFKASPSPLLLEVGSFTKDRCRRLATGYFGSLWEWPMFSSGRLTAANYDKWKELSDSHFIAGSMSNVQNINNLLEFIDLYRFLIKLINSLSRTAWGRPDKAIRMHR